MNTYNYETIGTEFGLLNKNIMKIKNGKSTMTQFDNTIAMCEGWCITNGTNDTDDKWRLTKFEEMNVFTADVNVWEFVYSLAQKGSFYHQSAIKYLEQECPEEFQRIENHYHYMEGHNNAYS